MGRICRASAQNQGSPCFIYPPLPLPCAGVTDLAGIWQGAEAFWPQGGRWKGKGEARWVTGLSAPPRCNPSLGGCNHPLCPDEKQEGHVTKLYLSHPPLPASSLTGCPHHRLQLPHEQRCWRRGAGGPQMGTQPGPRHFHPLPTTGGAEITPAPSRLPGEIRSEPAGRQGSALQDPKSESFSGAFCLFATQPAPSCRCMG